MSDFSGLCYKCKHRGAVPGDAHSCCLHPKIGDETDKLEHAIMFNIYGKSKLQIIGNFHAIKQGYFSWPLSFDPIWLENCLGFEQREVIE